MKTVAFEVGKPFPDIEKVPFLLQEGCRLELLPLGLTCIIQMPGLSRQKKQAFKKFFKTYSYLESSTPVPVAFWIFAFPKPFNEIEVSFNSKLIFETNPDMIDWYLDTSEGVNNFLYFILLDSEIIRGLKKIRLDPEAVLLFHETIRKQIQADYSQADYDKYSSALFQYTVAEMMQMGRIFRSKKKKG